MWNFRKDLELGNEYEELIVDLLNSYFHRKNHLYFRNEDNKWVDILSTSNIWIEVKYDRQSTSTWNIFIEYECRWKLSWVFKYQEMKIFIYGTWSEIFFFTRNSIQWIVLDVIHWRNKQLKKINWGDWWKSKWILIPVEIANKISFRKLNIWLSTLNQKDLKN